ncbi:MarR family winged helix-turn-helix transcriptional regulator [Paraferrimonas sedimenticola]|uniref:MarR family transcriptional regulator n=1 Tax=Paraferrimonas sedimenticola TaxID=375674 RepID=A0AA37RYN2_9GAMM|nr:MarR family transcriptional regulator [Paraferrimonas sedimenticola]GLP97860.1 MarR family transcriptional regulator [Paraferrimonas sedimenticola]
MQQRDSLVYQVGLLNGKLVQSLDEQLERYQLDARLWPVLFVLWQQQGLTQTELAAKCNVQAYTITRMLDQLQKLGLIERRQEPDNRRILRIFLTDCGQAIEQDLILEAQKVEDGLTQKLTEQEREQLTLLLAKLNASND